eukprot:11292763-Alexandrium_andersonii.AAC.1
MSEFCAVSMLAWASGRHAPLATRLVSSVSTRSTTDSVARASAYADNDRSCVSMDTGSATCRTGSGCSARNRAN